MNNSSWYSKIESRWAARGAVAATDGLDSEVLELRRVPTNAERMISAPRAAVWAVVYVEDDDSADWHQKIVGAPATGIGARRVSVGPPLPPFGMRTVMYSEVTAVQEGYWFSSHTLAGTWEHTETLLLRDCPDGRTLAQITGWWTKPAPRTADFTKLQTDLNGLAAKALDRLAAHAEGGSPPAASHIPS